MLHDSVDVMGMTDMIYVVEDVLTLTQCKNVAYFDIHHLKILMEVSKFTLLALANIVTLLFDYISSSKEAFKSKGADLKICEHGQPILFKEMYLESRSVIFIFLIFIASGVGIFR